MNNILVNNVSFSRSREECLAERLDGLVSVPQEWHKKQVWELSLFTVYLFDDSFYYKEDLKIYNQQYNLPHQTSQPGTLQNVQQRFHHNKV